jgi:predicted MFS family arabinose efflux permease
VLSRSTLSEGRLLFLLGSVQFVNVLDFVMVMPLGPDFALALGIPTNQLGLVTGAYTAAAAVAGLAVSSFLDKFDRRSAMVWTLLGLAVGTCLGGLATGLWSLVLSRVVAGVFGGPATSVCLSILTDAIPVERRGRAMGKVMGAFSVASVVGIPVGLELASLGAWHTPFFTVAGLCLVAALASATQLPPMVGHLTSTGHRVSSTSLASFLANGPVLLSFSCSALAMIGAFAIITNLSSFVQFNLGYPREALGMLYMIGGVVTFFSMRVAGNAVDRWGAPRIVSVGTAALLTVIALAFIPARPLIPVVAIFAGFMLANSTRIVGLSSLTTRVPNASDRARFMSLQSAVQHISTSAGSAWSTWVLTEGPGGRLEGMPTVAVFSLGLSAVLPFLVTRLSHQLKERPALDASPPVLEV